MSIWRTVSKVDALRQTRSSTTGPPADLSVQLTCPSGGLPCTRCATKCASCSCRSSLRSRPGRVAGRCPMAASSPFLDATAAYPFHCGSGDQSRDRAYRNFVRQPPPSVRQLHRSAFSMRAWACLYRCGPTACPWQGYLNQILLTRWDGVSSTTVLLWQAYPGTALLGRSYVNAYSVSHHYMQHFNDEPVLVQ